MAFAYIKAFFGVMKSPNCNISMENRDKMHRLWYSILVRSLSVAAA